MVQAFSCKQTHASHGPGILRAGQSIRTYALQMHAVLQIIADIGGFLSFGTGQLAAQQTGQPRSTSLLDSGAYQLGAAVFYTQQLGPCEGWSWP